MRCHECDHGFECCHATSVRHGDGTTECLGDGPCDLAHDLHRFTAGCDELGCACTRTDDERVPLPLAA